MTTDNKTLADVQPGGRVRLGDGLATLPHPNYPISKTGLQNNLYTASQMQDYARTALAASQPVGATGKNSLTVGGGQEPVAYLDLGEGGYMDVGTDLSDEELAALPKGRHMLGIIGTYGVDGYKPAQAVDLGQFRRVIAAHRDSLTHSPRETAECDRLLALIDRHSVANK